MIFFLAGQKCRVGWLRLIRVDYREKAWEVLGNSREFSGKSLENHWYIGRTSLGNHWRRDRAGPGGARQLPGRSDDTWPDDGRHVEVYEVKSVPGR